MLCTDIAESEVKSAVHDITSAGYDCWQTTLGGLGVTASVTLV